MHSSKKISPSWFAHSLARNICPLCTSVEKFFSMKIAFFISVNKFLEMCYLFMNWFTCYQSLCIDFPQVKILSTWCCLWKILEMCFYVMCKSGFLAFIHRHIYVYTSTHKCIICVQCPLNLLELELLAVVNHLVGIGNWTHILCKGRKSSELLSRLSSPHLLSFLIYHESVL